jgi:glycosyltransferase involved in cell wall biosynthesis
MAGGTEHQLVLLISQLNRERFAPYVVCLYGERAGRSLHFLEDLRKLNIPVLLLDMKWSIGDKARAVIMLTRIIWEIRPHVIQAVNYHSNLLLRFIRLVMPCSMKLVGGIYVEYTSKQIFYEYLSGWLCNAIVCNSAVIQQQLPRYLSPQLIFNGVDIDRFSRTPDATLRNRLSPHAECILLVMGRISRQKSPHLLVEALGILKQRDQLPAGISVWIVGESQEQNAQNQLNTIIRQYNLESVVLHFPATKSPEMYYHAADIVVLPSLWEGLPNVILEALSAGKPLIVSEAANNAGVIKTGVNGWIVSTGDSENLAVTLLEVFALDWNSTSRSCRLSAIPFSMIKMVQSYEALYNYLSARS